MKEQQALIHLRDRLTSTFDHLPPERVVGAIRDAYRRFDDVPVRDYVPLLVERRVRAELDRAH